MRELLQITGDIKEVYRIIDNKKKEVIQAILDMFICEWFTQSKFRKGTKWNSTTQQDKNNVQRNLRQKIAQKI